MGNKKQWNISPKRRDITITTTDIGGAVVIMDTENYIKEANRQLSEKKQLQNTSKKPHFTTQ